MKRIYLSIVLLAIGQEMTAQWGNRDSTFGTNGVVITDIGDNDVVHTVLEQPDGKILAGGSTGDNGQEDFALMRYSANGSPDLTFGTDGKVILSIGNGTDVGKATLLQSDGKIVMVGYTQVSGQSSVDFAIVRFTANGTVDSTYGTNGITKTAIGTGIDYGFSAVMQPDGKVVAGGYIGTGDGGDFAMVRYNTDGTPDSTFNATGVVVTDITGGADIGMDIQLQPDGKIILSGYVSNGGTNYKFGMARYNPNGTLDNTFGTAGIVTTEMGTDENVSTAAAIQADGKIILSGYLWNLALGKTEFALARYTANGTLDNTFGTGGKVFTSVGTGHNFAQAIVMQPDGKIVVAGQSSDPVIMHASLTRFNANGTPDSTFGDNGKIYSPLGPSADGAFALGMQADGKILLGGHVSGTGSMDALIIRYHSGITLGVVAFNKENTNMLVYPNPVNEHTTLEYTLAEKDNITITIKDVQGRTVSTLVNDQVLEAGSHKESLAIPNDLPSGNYFIILSSPKGQAAVQITK